MSDKLYSCKAFCRFVMLGDGCDFSEPHRHDSDIPYNHIDTCPNCTPVAAEMNPICEKCPIRLGQPGTPACDYEEKNCPEHLKSDIVFVVDNRHQIEETLRQGLIAQVSKGEMKFVPRPNRAERRGHKVDPLNPAQMNKATMLRLSKR